jgi:hypothetical protein
VDLQQSETFRAARERCTATLAFLDELEAAQMPAVAVAV